jgi:hypothetical protein
MSSSPRSSEKVAESEIANAQKIKRGLKGVAGLGTAAVGIGLGSKIMPFLNEYIPTDIALKGISKVSPKFGDFLNRGLAKGLDAKSGLDYIKENLSKKQAPNERNIIEQYSPELHQFLTGEIQKGRQPLEAGALAETSGKYKKAIQDMVKDHKAPFSSILESVFGSAQQPQQPQQQAPQQGQQQPENGDQALMAALQKILQM